MITEVANQLRSRSNKGGYIDDRKKTHSNLTTPAQSNMTSPIQTPVHQRIPSHKRNLSDPLHSRNPGDPHRPMNQLPQPSSARNAEHTYSRGHSRNSSRNPPSQPPPLQRYPSCPDVYSIPVEPKPQPPSAVVKPPLVRSRSLPKQKVWRNMKEEEKRSTKEFKAAWEASDKIPLPQQKANPRKTKLPKSFKLAQIQLDTTSAKMLIPLNGAKGGHYASTNSKNHFATTANQLSNAKPQVYNNRANPKVTLTPMQRRGKNTHNIPLIQGKPPPGVVNGTVIQANQGQFITQIKSKSPLLQSNKSPLLQPTGGAIVKKGPMRPSNILLPAPAESDDSDHDTQIPMVTDPKELLTAMQGLKLAPITHPAQRQPMQSNRLDERVF